MSLWR